jgi:hypothetical protein
MKQLLIVVSLLLCVLPSMGRAQEPIKVPKVAIYPWTFAENEKGTSEAGISTVQTLLKKLFEVRGGCEVISDVISKAAWKELNYGDIPLTVEDPGQVPLIPDAKKLLEFGKRVGADYVCAGTVSWRVRSVWVGLGPKTKADATVSVTIVNVAKSEVALEVKDANSNSTKAEKWYESAGAILIAWGITLFSGGPKTPHIQKAGVKGIGVATEPFFAAIGRKIGG